MAETNKKIKSVYSCKNVFELNGSVHFMYCTKNCEVYNNCKIVIKKISKVSSIQVRK